MGPGSLLGYRSMWYCLIHKYDLSVRRFVKIYVAIILLTIKWTASQFCSYWIKSKVWGLKCYILLYRDTVMVLLGLMDPQGTKQRKSKRLKRRICRSKVAIIIIIITIIQSWANNKNYRGQISCGIVMATIN